MESHKRKRKCSRTRLARLREPWGGQPTPYRPCRSSAVVLGLLVAHLRGIRALDELDDSLASRVIGSLSLVAHRSLLGSTREGARSPRRTPLVKINAKSRPIGRHIQSLLGIHNVSRRACSQRAMEMRGLVCHGPCRRQYSQPGSVTCSTSGWQYPPPHCQTNNQFSFGRVDASIVGRFRAGDGEC